MLPAAAFFPMFWIPLAHAAQRRLGLLEVPAGVSEVDVVEAHARFEQLHAGVGEVEPAASVVERVLQREAA